MKVCIECKHELEDKAKFCSECGASQTGAAQSSATNQGAGAIAQTGGVAAGASGLAVGTVQGNVYFGPPAKDPAEAIKIYRSVLVQSSCHLPMRGVDMGASDPSTVQKPLNLANVYIDLDTTTQVERNKSKAKKSEPDRETRPLSALNAVITRKHLVLLGDSGGGKSTFVNHLAYCLAAQRELPDWPKTDADLLPVIVILRDFARSLPEKLPAADPSHLWDFIATRLRAQKLDFAIESLEQALERGKAVLLLDGLDEVPSLTQRKFVRDAVTAFSLRYPRNRYLVTCRVLSYQNPDLRLPGSDWPVFELAKFDEAKIQRFIQAWYSELAQQAIMRNEDVAGMVNQLQTAVRRPDLWRLAANPLLLTVMALVHTHKGRLPDARALLYEDTVDILLWRWEQVKLGGQEETAGLRQLLLAANRTETDLKRTLGQLAFNAHVQVEDHTDGEKLADISEWVLQKSLAALKGDDHNWAKQLIDTIKHRAGLLLERAPEVFTFLHRTFQEYLAGAHLSAQGKFAQEACSLAGQGNQWREAILLAVGRLVYLSGDRDKPLALVGELCPAVPGDTAIAWQKAWLAADALLEIGINRSKDSALGRDLLQRVRERLVALIAGGKLAPRERANAGNSLARLGDPRLDPEHWYLPLDPLFGFIPVPAEQFIMGEAEDDKKKLPPVDLPLF